MSVIFKNLYADTAYYPGRRKRFRNYMSDTSEGRGCPGVVGVLGFGGWGRSRVKTDAGCSKTCMFIKGHVERFRNSCSLCRNVRRHAVQVFAGHTTHLSKVLPLNKSRVY